jgi:hypothetical protein
MPIVPPTARPPAAKFCHFLLTLGQADIGFRWSRLPQGERPRGERKQAFAGNGFSSPRARFLGQL